MGTGIIICGLNGAGKSTLGRALAEKLDFHFIDIEELFFTGADPDHPYTNPRPRREAEGLLSGRIKAHENFILASVTGNYGQDITSFFKYAVFVDVARKIRLQRVKSRSFEKFGDRILPGGDLYEQEERFFDFAASRNEKLVEEWIRSLSCPVIRVDGTKPVEENAELLKASFQAAVGPGSVCLP